MTKDKMIEDHTMNNKLRLLLLEQVNRFVMIHNSGYVKIHGPNVFGYVERALERINNPDPSQELMTHEEEFEMYSDMINQEKKEDTFVPSCTIETEIDNRDGSETWFWINEQARIEVMTRDLTDMIAENNPTDKRAVLHAALDQLIDKYEQDKRHDPGTIDLRLWYCHYDEDIDDCHNESYSVLFANLVDGEWVADWFTSWVDTARPVTFKPTSSERSRRHE